jgi:hypothetical protein
MQCSPSYWRVLFLSLLLHRAVESLRDGENATIDVERIALGVSRHLGVPPRKIDAENNLETRGQRRDGRACRWTDVLSVEQLAELPLIGGRGARRRRGAGSDGAAG